MTRRAARVFRAEAFADGLTNDDGNNGDGYNSGKEGEESGRGGRAADDILPSAVVKHRFFPVSPCTTVNLARLSEKIKFFCNRNRSRGGCFPPDLEIARCPAYI